MASAQVAATPDPYPLSRALLEAVLADRLSDRFVCELIWSRLGYVPDGSGTWSAGPATGAAWREPFPIEPQFIAQREVHQLDRVCAEAGGEKQMLDLFALCCG